MWYLRKKKELSGRWRILFIYFFSLSSERITVRGTSLPYTYNTMLLLFVLHRSNDESFAVVHGPGCEVENSCLTGVGWILFYWKSWNIS